ncbi:MAG: response regulator transcription factor [Solirubrobacteraceae bacterium]
MSPQLTSFSTPGTDSVSGVDGNAPQSPITIVLADDHRVVRSGLRVLLESDSRFHVLDEAGDVEGTITKVRNCRPQVLVLDLNMGGESSLDSIPQLRTDVPETQIVVLTMQENPAFAQAALRAGAVGYVLKDAADEELMNAVVSASNGRTYLNPELGAKLATQPPESGSRPDGLSPREVEVLTLIALGHTNSEIAGSLFLSVRTVESHRAHIQQKIGLTTRADLVGYARSHGLLD